MRNLSQSRAMIDAIGGIRALLKWESLRPDNFVFRLHYKVSFAFLLLCSFIVTAKQYVGDPIDCVTSAAVEKLIDQYCWIHSTYTITRLDKFGRHTFYYGSDDQENDNNNNKRTARLPSTNPLLDPSLMGYPGIHSFQSKHELRLYHRYYQWVCYVLFIQAILFYLPCYIWKIFDGGQLKVLVAGLQLHSFNQHMMNLRKEQILSYFVTYKGHWTNYVVKFYICEVLNFINLAGQIYLMDKFFGHMFSSFGLSLLNLTDEDPYKRTDSLAIIFPKVTKCTFNAHGIGGGIVNHDAICVLSVNNINEKIYIFLWFWFFILLVLTLFQIFYRLLTLISWRIRFYLLNLRYSSKELTPQLKTLVFLLNSSDWFMLYEISKNVHARLFVSIAYDLNDRIRKQKIKLGNSVTSV